MTPRAGLAAAVVATLTAGPLAAQEPPLWGGLKAGRHAVGYRRTPLAEGTLHVWFPAAHGTGAALEVRAYVTGPTTLAARVLGAPTAAVRADAAAPGRFPVILYAGEPGSAEPDNTVLAEYLASHGYVVAAMVGGRGLEPVLAAVAGLPFARGDAVGVIARAGGWNAAVELAAARPAVRAILGLDPPDQPVGVKPGRSLAVLRLRPDGGGRRSQAEPAAPGADGVTVTIPRSTAQTFSDGPAHLDLLGRPDTAAPDRRRLIGSVAHAFLDGAVRAWGPSLMELATHLSRAGLGVSSRFPTR